MKAAMLVRLTLLALTTFLTTLHAESISIGPNPPTHPFPHFWEEMFGSGRAILTLRESWRADLRTVRRVTGVRYVRFHAIFHDEVGLYVAPGKYNFSYIDEIYDGLLASGVRPFVELSFMPRGLAASQTPHAFWYKPLPNPPSDYSRWADLVAAFTRHLIQRYGAEEVRQWYFEVWNEPNIDFWTGQPRQSTYFELYDYAARAVKSVDPQLRVGGPATAQAAWIAPFIEHCVKSKVPLDFVTTHVYGNDSAEDVFGTHEKIPRRDMVARAARKVHDEVRKSALPNLPIIWSEYNATYLNDANVTDSPFMGPWLANNIRECDGLAQFMSYWSLSDVFEEQGVVQRPFYGGYGLIAAGGIPKAAYNAFALLHELGTQRIPIDSENAIATRRPDGSIALAIWNYAEPGEQPASREFDLKIAGARSIRIRQVDRDSGSALTKWEQMGKPDFPTREQQAQLRSAAQPPAARPLRGTKVTLAPQALALIEITLK